MPLTRYLAPSASRATIGVAGGRSVTADPTTLLADVADQDCSYLGSNAWLCLGPVGVTSARPSLPASARGFRFLDTTLGKDVWWTGAAWIDPATGSAV